MCQPLDTYVVYNNYQIIKMVKAIHDYKKEFMGKVKEIYVESDYLYDAFWTCLSLLIPKIRDYYSDDWEEELVFLRDKRIDDYFQLIKQYCKLQGIDENDNQYMKEAMDAINDCLDFQCSNYDCDFRYNKKTHRACRILLGFFGDFNNYSEIIENYIGLIEFFEERTEKIQQEITSIKRLEAAA